ncbi:type II toxin-antitoxin system RelE/ParE family toxin [Maridesulfovibrio salexigens]|uniref:Plasmid stabilization system n=1 Tax=Maridesulfovibrio salexigens (strain ATCC 14822 / DSM 2638 / NCIMB 8403 / VKM B-1763) TaxID=526222 RepID=C6BVJ5_MARSD|nr:type II toxin-antitoxin system RelE/ParE family toxin [Maridesulfovibrio salexigens]ACS78209.1 plasmid stabilization system [Maridesulfovibrio salexigens DSM 2638]
MRVKWLRGALKDLDAEASYLATEDVDLAQKTYSHIRDRGDLLGNFPQKGRPGRVPGTRELVLDRYPYIIPYRVKNDVVEILRVFHTRRKLPKDWDIV